MPEPFGSFGWICRHTTLPQCNLYFRQLLQHLDPPALTTLFPPESKFFDIYNVTSSSSREDPNVQAALREAGVGLGASCEIAQAGLRGSVGDIAQIITSAIALVFGLFLIYITSRREAAVGRLELRFFLVLFSSAMALQIVTMSALFDTASVVNVILSSIHVGVIMALFWSLLGNAIVATQVVEDGTPAAMVPFTTVAVGFLGFGIYLGLDISLHISQAFLVDSASPKNVRGITLFVLTLLWPAIAAMLYLVIMLYIVLVRLREIKPALFFLGSFSLFAGGQVVFFLASQPLCDASNGRINGAFLTTILNASAVGLLFLAWRAITEDHWEDDPYNQMYR